MFAPGKELLAQVRIATGGVAELISHGAPIHTVVYSESSVALLVAVGSDFFSAIAQNRENLPEICLLLSYSYIDSAEIKINSIVPSYGRRKSQYRMIW